MKVLVACECSGVVRDAFAERGHDAWSCDLKPSESFQPVVFASELPLCECCGEERWCEKHEMHYGDCVCLGPTEDGVIYSDDGMKGSRHIQGDAIEIMKDDWDLMIAHPPCTHLSCSGARHFEKKRADGRQQQGIDLFLAFTRSNIKKVCIENPVGIMSSKWREPDQIIKPYYFGDEAQKTTCLWLKNLPPLMHIDDDDLFYKKTHVDRGEMVTFASGKVMPKWYCDALKSTDGHGTKRSRTFPGIARAMAVQWG